MTAMKILLVAAVLAASAPIVGLAADAESDVAVAPVTGRTVQIEEIVVTAEKRSQKLSDVGATVAVADSEQLQNAGITDVGQLSTIVTGLTVATTQNGYPVFSLRGVNFNGSQSSAPPAVSVYLDEAPLPYSFMTAGMLFDVDHVEVVKGPQGTLFGENATGGSINVIAAKPTSTFSAGAQTDVNNFGQVTFGGYVSGPLTGQLKARLAATTTQFGAWQKDVLNGTRNGAQDKSATRLLLEWTPTDRLTVNFDLEGRYDNSQLQQPQFAYYRPATAPAGRPAYPNYSAPTSNEQAYLDGSFDTRQTNDIVQAVVRVDYSLTDTMKLTSITNFLHANFSAPENVNGTEGGDANGVEPPISFFTGSGSDVTYSQELRLSGSAFDKRLSYIVGGNYQRDKLVDALDTELVYLPHNGFEGQQLYTRFQPENRAAGVFGNVDYELIPGLSLTGGARYTATSESTSGCAVGNALMTALYSTVANASRVFIAGLPPTNAYQTGSCIDINDTGAAPTYLPTSTNLSQKENNVSWRVGVNYKPTTDTLLYGLVSRGFKAGVYPVFGVVFQSQLQPVKQEELTSYELGAKASFFNHLLTLDGSVFYYQYVDKQFYTFEPTGLGFYVNDIKNIPHSTVKGVDLDVTAIPVEGLTVRGAATYIDTYVGEFESYPAGEALTDFKGSQFNFAPPVSATVDAEYKRSAMEGVDWFIGGGLLYNARTYSDLGEQAINVIPAYTIFNARLGVETVSGWRVSLWGRNLGNKFYSTNMNTPGESVVRFSGMPRTFGVSASYKF